MTGYVVRARLRQVRRALFPGRRFHYGDEGTIHQTGELNVEVDKHGRVVAVWFRCAMLPFTQTTVEWDRVKDMRHIYDHCTVARIAAVDLILPPPAKA
jgi:hypothetical protein